MGEMYRSVAIKKTKQKNKRANKQSKKTKHLNYSMYVCMYKGGI